MKTADVSESNLRGQVDRVSKRRADIAFEKLRSRLDRRDVLTEDQQKKLRRRKR